MLSDSIKKLDEVLRNIIKGTTIAMLFLLSLLYFLRIIFRFLSIKFSFHWADELIEMCFAGIVFLGASELWMVKGHFSAGNFITKLMKTRLTVSIYKILLEIISLIFIVIFLKYSFDLTVRSREVSAVLEIPKSIHYGVMPLSGLIMTIYTVGYLIFEIRMLIKPEPLKVNTDETGM